MLKPTEKLLRLPDVEARTGLKRSTIYARISAGTFPRQVRFSRRFAAWTESSIDRWIADVIAQAHNGQ